MENLNQEMQNQNDNANWLLPASILAAGVLIAGAVIYSTGAKNLKNTDNDRQNKIVSQTEPKINQNDVVLGNANAPVTIIEFGDYQCPFCGKFAIETEPQIKKNYIQTGKAKMVYKDLAFLGLESVSAANAAQCAKEQGKFWQFHDKIFETEYAEAQKVLAGKLQSSENSGNLNRGLFEQIAGGLKMNVKDFLNCFDSKKYQSEIDGNMKEADAALSGRISTPAVFINGQLIQGAQPYSVFSKIIDMSLEIKK